jgi:protein involved in polysaccharide export with SLBB domain
MSCALLKKMLFIFCLGCFLAVGQANAQEADTAPKRINFRYSQNPKTKSKSAPNENQNTQSAADTRTDKTAPEVIASLPNGEEDNSQMPGRSAAAKTLEVAKRANTAAIKPTEIYKVGAGDVLLIGLQNVPAKSASYFTVLDDGSIDYPLVGEMISVAGLTTDEIEDLLKEKIKLYENAQVSVKIRDYASHKFTVLGLVEKAGEKYLQREAVPLFIVRADAVAQAKANRVTIKRADSTTETLDMSDPKYEDVLVFAGDIVEFGFSDSVVTTASQPQFFYIGGNVNSLGQKDFYPGITLTQAILASGGLRKSTAKKVVVRRKNANGLLTPTEYNLKAINDGKEPDPVLQAGDTIEVGN